MNIIKRELISLYLIQISNIIFPIIIFAYMANTLGVIGLGKLAFYQTISMLVAFLVDFGFSLSAARILSISVNNAIKVNEIYTNVQVSRYCLWIIVSIISFLATHFVNLSYEDLKIFYIALISGLASILTCSWVFQGLTKNSTLAIITLIFKIISTIFILVFVKSYADLYQAIYIQLIASFIVGVCASIYIKIKYKIILDIKLIKIGKMKNYFYESYHNFIASFFTLGFTYLNPLFVKYFFGDGGLGLYSTAEKVVSLLKQAFIPVSQTFYAEMCRLSHDKKYKNIIQKNKKIFGFFSILCLISFVLNMLIGNSIYEFVFGESFDIYEIVGLMIVVQWIVSIAIIIVNLMIIPLGESKILKKVYSIGLIFYILIVYPFLKFFELKGLIISMIITETFITIVFFIFTYKFMKSKMIEH